MPETARRDARADHGVGPNGRDRLAGAACRPRPPVPVATTRVDRPASAWAREIRRALLRDRGEDREGRTSSVSPEHSRSPEPLDRARERLARPESGAVRARARRATRRRTCGA
jgi:hypothetical protein